MNSIDKSPGIFTLRRLWVGTLIVLVVGIGASLVLTLRIAQSLRIAYHDSQNFLQLVNSGPINDVKYEIAHSFLQSTTSALADANRDMRWSEPILARLGWIPVYGSTITSAPLLVDVAQRLAEIGNELFVIAQPALTTSSTSSLLAQLPSLLAASQPQLITLTTSTASIVQDLTRIDSQQLVDAAIQPVVSLQAGVSLLHAGLSLSESLPELLGSGKRKTYLVLVQNNYELRGTGGFITAVGTLTIKNGKISDFAVADSYDVPNGEGRLPRAPIPMQRHMNIGSLVLRDANWSPDLPTTAQLATTLYLQATGQATDGVIALDLRAVELFVAALEPLMVAGSDEPITGANVVSRMKELWAAPLATDATIESDLGEWWEQRKDFVPLLAAAMLSRLQSGNLSYTSVASALQRSLDEGAVQLWSNNEAIQMKLSELGWAGGMSAPADSDFVALVDSNMGYNKVDAVIERALAYQVDWSTSAGEAAIATLQITYRHMLPVPDHTCDALPQYGATYDDMMARCYFNFVRIYVPAGSDLVGIDGIEADSQLIQHGEGNSEVFGGYLIVRPGEEKRITLQYRLPATLRPESYTLVLRKQAGITQLPITLNIARRAASTVVHNTRYEWSRYE